MFTNKKQVLWVVVVTAVFLTFSLALASGELLPRSAVSGGGGPVSQGGYALRSAIGQPVAGAVQNGVSLCSGFWCGLGAPGGPFEGEIKVYLPVVIRP